MANQDNPSHMTEPSSTDRSTVSQLIADREACLLAPYAMHSAETVGREYAEPQHPYRGPFQRDRDRIIHSAAYRRLAHKTQVFTGEMGDYHRTRLTHTQEVSSIARSLGRAVRLNEDLIEALALAHDIGHPPFGHAGEDTLNECLAGDGGFNHNRQALRIVEHLETRYADFPGLNLSHEVLAGQATRVRDIPSSGSPLLEVQVVDAADSVAYNTHDVDDALEVGLIELEQLFEVSLWSEAQRRIRKTHQAIDGDELKRAVLHELIEWQVSDLLQQTTRNIAAAGVDCSTAVGKLPRLVQASSPIAEQKREMETFLHAHVYRHPKVVDMRRRAQGYLREMFERYTAQEQLLPAWFQARCPRDGVARTVGDYLGGMTDRFAQQEHTRISRDSSGNDKSSLA